MRDGDCHDDERYARIGGVEHRAEPAGEPHSGVDHEHQHDNDGQSAPYRTQQKGCSGCDDRREYNGYIETVSVENVWAAIPEWPL